MNNKDVLLSQKNDIIDQYVYMTTSDLDGIIVDISEAYLNFTGYAKEEVIGKNHSIFRNKELDATVISELWDVLLSDNVWKGELLNQRLSGEDYWIQTVITPLFNADKQKVGYCSIKVDITEQKQLQEMSITDPLTQLHNRRYFDHYFKRELNRISWKKEKFALLLLSIDYYMDYKDAHGRIHSDNILLNISDKLKEYLSNKTYELFKVTEAEFAIILLNYEDEYIEELSNGLLQSVESLKIANEKSKISDHFTMSIGGINLATSDHNLYCNDIYNITDENLSKAKVKGKNCFVLESHDYDLKSRSNIDQITKLPNRSALLHDIDTLHQDAMLIILHIKQINTLMKIYGFEFTKSVVTKKAGEIQNVLRDEEATLYSLNLKEFAILITEKSLFDKYLLLLQHSLLVNNELYINSLDDYISADFTVGIAYGQFHIFNHADSVLQEAILSKISYKIYKSNQSVREELETSVRRLQVYKHALHSGNIVPFFQPIFDSKTEELIKYEALARIETDDGEIVSPQYFLDSAKEDKSFEYFTRQMMQKVFNVYALNSVAISINISYENVVSSSMLEYINNRLEKYGGEGITFEIVESEDIKDYSILEEFISMVKPYGCKISIDDFGSGYSNFAQISKLDIDYIKIDGSLIEKLNTDKNIQHMITGLLEYTRNAKIKTIAEFVSSPELAVSVKKLGIDYMQGYNYGTPKPPQEYGLKT